MEMIPWPQIGIGSGWLFVGFFVTLFYRGRIVPRSSLDDVIHDRDEWRAESRIKDAQIAELHEQFHLVPEVARNVLVIMRALKQGSQGDES